MLCRNCNNQLSTDEDFCPRCGTPQKLTDASVLSDNKLPEEKSTPAPEQKSSIFHSEPIYIYTDPPKENKKSKAPVIFVSLFVITLLIIGTLTLAEYFQLTPAFSQLFTPESTTEPLTDSADTPQDYDSHLGTISPEINLKSTICTVTSERGLALRKGPDNAYAKIEDIYFGTALQVIGKNTLNDIWAYVYIPSLDLYGWVSGSYITENSVLESLTSAESEEETSKTKDN
jgi:hypothetical protein